MAIDPAVFDMEAESLGLVRWPDKGERILWRARGGEWAEATVELVWIGIEVMINLTGEGVGRHASCCPGLGDEFALLGDGYWSHAVTGEAVTHGG